MPRRTFSLRLKTELADRLALVAAVQRRTQADVIRECLEKSLDAVVADEGFQTTLRERIEAQHALLTFAPPEGGEDLSAVEEAARPG